MDHIWKTGGYFFPLLYICLLCDEVLQPYNFRSPGFNVRAPQDPPNIKTVLLFSYFGLKLKTYDQIASLFHMYIDMSERIAGKQDMPSLIIEDPLRAPKLAQNIFFFTFWPINEKLVFKLFPLIISRGAEGPGREILQPPPPVCLSVCLSVCPSRLVFAL